MENTKQYGDLSEKELLELLNEIENDDEDIKDAEDKARANIIIEEEHTELIEEPENNEIEAYYGNDAWRKLNNGTCMRGPEVQKKATIGCVKANKQKSQKLKKERIDIQRKAFRQELIKLSDPIGNDNTKLLVSLLVADHTRMIEKYSNYINKRLAALLNPFIPRRLRVCKSLYPDSIRISLGFMYKASKEFGNGLSFWATPNIPYFFSQNTEQKILLANKPDFLIPIDKAVVLYHEHSKKRTEKELKYASSIIQKGVYTYFDLLRLNPFWYEALYNHLETKINKQ